MSIYPEPRINHVFAYKPCLGESYLAVQIYHPGDIDFLIPRRNKTDLNIDLRSLKILLQIDTNSKICRHRFHGSDYLHDDRLRKNSVSSLNIYIFFLILEDFFLEPSFSS